MTRILCRFRRRVSGGARLNRARITERQGGIPLPRTASNFGGRCHPGRHAHNNRIDCVVAVDRLRRAAGQTSNKALGRDSDQTIAWEHETSGEMVGEVVLVQDCIA